MRVTSALSVSRPAWHTLVPRRTCSHGRTILQGGGRRLGEPETRRVFAQIIDAVDYCHRRRAAM
jgi:serine/threonine protein kinase